MLGPPLLLLNPLSQIVEVLVPFEVFPQVLNHEFLGIYKPLMPCQSLLLDDYHRAFVFEPSQMSLFVQVLIQVE